MNPSSIRAAVLFTTGIVIGGLVVWGLTARFRINSAGGPVIAATTPAVTLTKPESSSTPELTPDAAEEKEAVVPSPSPSASASPAPRVESNGLPLGVTQKALNPNKDVYKKLPGVQPPVINADGRNLGPEATQRLQAPTEPVPYPGFNPNASLTPMPFPKNAEEANRSAQPYLSPSPAPSAH